MAPQEIKMDTINIALKKHENDGILIDNKIYSYNKLREIHPGGGFFIDFVCGRDATELFLSYHNRNFPHLNYKGFVLETLSDSNLSNVHYTADYLELCDIICKILPREQQFATLSYYLKITVLLLLTICLETHMHVNNAYNTVNSSVLGLLFAFIGLNVQHDANHGSISPRAWVNRVLGMTQNLIGGSAVSWIHQHDIQHHIYCNDVHKDPDIMGGNLIRLNPLKVLKSSQYFQYIYVFIMIAGFGFKQVIATVQDTLNNKNYTYYSNPIIKKYLLFELFTSILFFIRWLIIPSLNAYFHSQNILYNLLCTTPIYMVAGYYLAFFFILSHNFDGVHAFDDTKYINDNLKSNSNNRFLYRQVVSSSNVGGSILGFFNGGLNYQIEHHLFPRIQHSHYPTIAPYVRAYCNKQNIPYRHFPTIHENFISCSKHLFKMGTTINKEIIE